MLARVELLYRGALPRDSTSGNPFRRATSLTNLFSTFYNHGIPFDRSLLRAAWSGCDGAGGGSSSCQMARVQANARLDRFEVPRGPLTAGLVGGS
jgi:hypothetical protein